MSVYSVYGSAVAGKIMSTIDLHRRGVLRQRELARAVGDHLSAVQQALAQLEKRNLIIVSDEGGHPGYSINRGSVHYPGVHSLALADLGVSDLLGQWAGGISAALIYGSVAIGDARPESDLDILIIGDIDQTEAEAALRPIANQLERRLDVAVLDFFTFRERQKNQEAFLAKALATGAIVMGRVPS